MPSLAAFALIALTAGPPQAPQMPQEEIDAARKLEKEANQHQRAGRYAEAEKALLEAIAKWTKWRGPDDVETLNDTMNLAVSYRRRGTPDKAVPLLQRVVQGLERCKDPDAPSLRRLALNNLASAYRFSGQPAQAYATWEALLLELQKAGDLEERARALDNLAGLLSELPGEMAAAERYARQGYKTWTELRGDEAADDPDVAISGSVLGNILLAKGDLAEARRLLEDALRVHEKVGGPESPNVPATLNLIGVLEVKAGRSAQAKDAFRRSLEISRKLALDPRHHVVVEAEEGLKKLERAPGR